MEDHSATEKLPIETRTQDEDFALADYVDYAAAAAANDSQGSDNEPLGQLEADVAVIDYDDAATVNLCIYVVSFRR